MPARIAPAASPKLLLAVRDIGSGLGQYSGWLTFATAILLLRPILPFGFDVTDSGLHLANADMALRLGLLGAVVSPFWWLTDVLGGIWMPCTDSFGLLGVRWGWALAIAATAGLGTAMVQGSYGGGPTLALGGVLAACYSAMIPVMVPDYYIIPGLLGTVVSAAYLRGGLATRFTARAWWGLAAGALLGLAIGARLPMLLLTSLPVAHLGYLLWRRADRAAWILPLATMGVALAAVAFGIFVFWLSGTGPMVLDALFGLDTISGDGATIGGNFLANTWAQLTVMALPLLLVTIPLGCLVIAMRCGWPSVATGAAIASGLAIYFSFPTLTAGTGRFCGLVLLALATWLLFAAAELIGAARTAPRSNGEEGRVIVAIAAPVLALSLCAGSSLGLVKLSYGAGMLFPLTIGWGARLARGLCPIWARWVLSVAVIVPVALGAQLAWQFLFSPTTGYVYGDAPRAELTAPFEHGRLAGIFTQPGRRDSFQGLMDVVQQYSRPDDEIFAFSHLAMIYYATNRRPPLGLATPDLLPHARLREAVRQLCIGPQPRPVLIIRTHTRMPFPTWGTPKAELADAPLPGPFWEANRSIMDQTVEALCKPELLWSDRDFEVLRPRS
jgi:hypothetical protein